MVQRSAFRIALGFCVLLVFVVAARGQDIAIHNWSAPKTWMPPATPGAKRTMTDVTNPLPFIGVRPCRLADTRGLAGFSGQAGGPILAGNTTRNFVVAGTVPGLTTQCGIPAGAEGVSLNFTVTGMNTVGNLIAYPAGSAQPNTSVINWNASSVALGNGAVVPVGAGGSITVFPNVPAGGQTHLIIDVNGYFSSSAGNGETFQLFGNVGGGIALIYAANIDSTGYAIRGVGAGIGVAGVSNGSGLSFAGVYGTSINALGVYGFSTNTNGVWAQSTNWDALAAFGGRDGGYFQAARNGLVGNSVGTSGALYGVIGLEASADPGSAGVQGVSQSGAPTNTYTYGQAGLLGASVSGRALLAVTQFGGGTAGSFHRLDNISPFGETSRVELCPSGSISGTFFGDVFISTSPAPGGGAGNLSVVGTVSKGAGSFKIDHPLDPENKYLYHSFVESPDMMNVYNGNVILDSRGEATVVLPEYFEALNTDFRYQLTPIGRASQVLYIAEEIENNRFRIAGGRPGGKVSWQVTGIRQDAFAKAHRIPVEVEKVGEERGLYLHPVEHGKSEDKSVSKVLERAERTKEAEAAAKRQ
jgi:hypothetical protein